MPLIYVEQYHDVYFVYDVYTHRRIPTNFPHHCPFTSWKVRSPCKLLQPMSRLDGAFLN